MRRDIPERAACLFPGLVLRYAGDTWETMPTGYFDRLDAIDVSPCGGIHAAGDWGLILEYTD